MICIEEHRVYHEDQEEMRDRSMGQNRTIISKSLANEVIFRESLQEKSRKRRHAKTFIKQLKEHTAMDNCDITNIMEHRTNWKRFAILIWVNPN